jgi:hypothetical protein
MAKFKVQVERQSFLTLEVTAKDKIDAAILAQHKAKNREGWYNNHYNIINITSL